MLWIILVCWGTAWFVVFSVICLILRHRLQKRKIFQTQAGCASENRISIGLFHPYCNSVSGSERVLWVALRCLQTRHPSFQYVLYTGDTNAAPEEILAKTKERFNIVLPAPVEFVYLHKRKWVESSSYPYFTLLGQSLGSIYLGMEALFKFVPDVYIDTMGYTFTLPLFKYFGNCRVGCYIHSPLITTEMLHKGFRCDFPCYGVPRPLSSPYSIKSMLRLAYYKFLSKLYGWAGRCSDITMVNSTWTEERINQLWQCPSKTYRVFPPCDVEGFKNIQHPSSSSSPPNDDEDGSNNNKKEDEEDDQSHPQTKGIKIVSIGQFRPEKDHPLQIRTLYQLREILHEEEWSKIKLVIIGSCRNKEDLTRVKDMEDLCKHLSVERNIEFKVNISYEQLQLELSDALIGLHTAWNEQFGIGIVECMATGLIVVANRSGGPMMDIVMEFDGARNGFLATDENDYAEAIRRIIHMTPGCRNAIKGQAVASVDRFSDRQFNKAFLEAVQSSLFR